eukprot:CAMPEP_0182427700 /NCGR_PEP_ID=MMETSP1167-20130531/18993_1 /TAXON_ID=2988 /ORGANISM="Mallomonas Sp, Strain CCMP3275" /LENGTH=87 /DNA_ID=CAMNT_0024610123 /DNA_START=70 /DNA_END=333 /DNA_ORIENTATION=+
MAPKVVKASSSKVSKKSAKDGKPKKAPTAYIIFSTEKRAEVKAANPEATFGELGKLLGKMWAEMDDSDKEQYKQRQAELQAAVSAAK